MSEYEKHLHGLYKAIAAGSDADLVASFFHPDAEQIEYPSLLRPHGHRRPLSEIRTGVETGARLIRDQHFEVHRVVEQNDEVAVQLTWTATLAHDVGAISTGTRLVSHVAAFYRFRDGLVLQQSSYDCYEPFARAG